MRAKHYIPIPGILVALLASGTIAQARDIHYGAAPDVGVRACDELYWRGATDQSRHCYQQILVTPTDAAARAEAAWALGDLQTANSYFQKAMAANSDDMVTLSRWGDLFSASHQDAEAMNIYREVLRRDQDYAFALLGAAEVLAGGFDSEANQYLEQIVNDPDAHDGAKVGGWLLVARVALENGAIDEARNALNEADELINENGWPPLEIYALRAAADLLEGVEDGRWADQALGYNPKYGGVYATTAHFYVISRRYRDAIDMYQKAVEIDPELAYAHEQLGVNLLRDNQMTRARQHLEIAHDADPFSPVAVNTLRLLDSFSNFRLISDPETPGVDGEIPIVLRLHKDEAAAIAPYAIDLARDSIEEFTRRYDFALQEPVIIEMYPDHEDFAVRTAGMPGIGILGATFGYVIAMDSPSARAANEFQWGTTLWHEMAHVFTLEASKHLVPRWFSEGVSVYEEWRSGPNPGVHIPMSVYTAMRDDQFLAIAELDEGFIRPSYPEQVIVSYMQAGLVCQFIDQRLGSGKLALMLQSYAENATTQEAINDVLDMSTEQFDSEFKEFVQSEHGDLLANLDRWHELQAEVGRQFSENDWDAVSGTAAEMVRLHPAYVDPDSPYLMLAHAHNELGARQEAINNMQTFVRLGGYDPAALQLYTDWLLEDGRTDAAIATLQAITLVQPLDQALHGKLGDLLLAQGNPHAALIEFEIALAQEPHDKATAYYRIAQAQAQTGDTDNARDNLLLALDIAPAYRPAQRLLLELTRSASSPQTRNQQMEDQE